MSTDVQGISRDKIISPTAAVFGTSPNARGRCESAVESLASNESSLHSHGITNPKRKRTLGSSARVVFQYDEEMGQASHRSTSSGFEDMLATWRRVVSRPKLWWMLLGIFFTIILVLFSALFAVWYTSVERAVRAMSDRSGLALEDYSTVAMHSVQNLGENLDLRDMHAAKLAVSEYLEVPFLAVELLGGAMEEGYMSVDDVKGNVKFLWWLYRTLPIKNQARTGHTQPTLEGVFYGDLDGTYAAYTNQCSRSTSENCLAEPGKQKPFSFSFDFRPGDSVSDEELSSENGCIFACPPSGGLRKKEINFYTADGITGEPVVWFENKTYDPRPRPWYQTAVDAKGIAAWSDVYQDLLYEDGGHPDIGFSVARAFFKDSKPFMVAGATLTLAHMTELMKQQEHDPGSILLIVDRVSGKMVAHSGGFDLVVCKREGCAHNKQLLWNETNCNQTRAAVARMIHLHGSLQNINASGTLPVHGFHEYIHAYETLQNGNGAFALNWLMVHVQPAGTYTGRIVQALVDHEKTLATSVSTVETRLNHIMLVSAGLCISFVLVGSVCLAVISVRVTRPLKAIVKDMRSVAKLELDNIDSLLRQRSGSLTTAGAAGAAWAPCRIREVAEIREAFSDMATGLRSFSRYMDPYVVQVLIQSHQQAQLGVAKAEVSIFFSDVADFTSISESVEPTVLMEMMSEYLEKMSGIIMKHNGVVGEFIGDGIMAWWNAPWEVEGCDHTFAAILAAMEQQQRASELRSRWQEKGLPSFRVRMGLARGQVYAGNLGSKKRMKYGLMGDKVNLASRLESLCKRYGVQVLIEDEAYSAPGTKERFFLRPIDCVTVKGRACTTELYEVVACRSQVEGTTLYDLHGKFCADFVAIHELYRKREFKSALEAIHAYQQIWPGDAPAQIMRERCEALLANPPNLDWSPIEKLSEK